MEKFKWMCLLVLVSGLILGGCSSENDIIDNTDKKPSIDFSKLTWTKRTISSQIEDGSNTDINTRSEDEIGWDGNPTSVLPNDVEYYINVYNEERHGIEDKYLKLIYKDSDIEYYTSDPIIVSGVEYVLVNNTNDPGAEGDPLWFKVGKDKKTVPDNRTFFFTTANLAGQNAKSSTIKLPTATEAGEKDLYYNGAGYVEYGDKLFATEGHYFIRNSEDSEKIDLYYTSRTHQAELVEENRIRMKRLTGVITIYTIVADRYDGNTPINITGIDGGTSKEDAIKFTNQELEKAFDELIKNPTAFFSTEELEANDNYLSNFISNRFDKDYGVDDYFIRKKVLENYPVEYDFLSAVVDYNGEKGYFYLCNLNFPAWMNEKSSYHWGSKNDDQYIYGVSSSCDNYPFFPVGTSLYLDDCPLVIFMGMSKRDTEDTTYAPPSHLLQVRIVPEGQIEISPNKSHNMYVVFTIKDMVQMLVKAQMNNAVGTPFPKTRSELPSNRLIFK